MLVRRNQAQPSPLAVGLGVADWNMPPFVATSNFSPTSQTIYAVVVPTIAGKTYTGIELFVSTAGSGTAPSGFFVGLATLAATGSKGTMLAQSSDLHSSASLTTVSAQRFPFSAAYTETVSSARYAVVLKNGAFASTDVAFAHTSGPSGHAGIEGFGLNAICGTSQTALPSNGSQLPAAFSESGSHGIWVGLY